MNSKATIEKTGRLQKIDPFEESIDSLIVVGFHKSSSKNFSFALAIAESASRYGIAEFQGKLLHLAIFSKTQSEAGKALVLLRYVSEWIGTFIFHQGKMIQDVSKVLGVIECYTKANSCRDKQAHCCTVMDDPFQENIQDMSLSISFRLHDVPQECVQIDRYLFPCKMLSYWFKYQKEHPSSIQDQIQAAAVNQGCDWCPNFNPDNFRKIGTRTIKKDCTE